MVGELGERVVLYLEHIGRIEGVIARHPKGGFAIQLSATPRKRDKIASQLTWLANREMLGLPEGRTHERIVPKQPAVVVRLESGREIKARVIDISMSGVALASLSAPPLGTTLDDRQHAGQARALLRRRLRRAVHAAALPRPLPRRHDALSASRPGRIASATWSWAPPPGRTHRGQHVIAD